MSLLGLLVAVVILCLLYWAITTLTAAFGLDARIRAVVLVLFVVIAVLYVLATELQKRWFYRGAA